MSYDLIIRNGTVVDGSGNPRRRADVGVVDGRVAAVGFLEDETATEEIDATGRIVAPGIVDAHTHYDPQLTWDPYATASCFHGVTTVLAGNCGFSVSPCRTEDRDFFGGVFAQVEGMDPVALSGIDWQFETFAEYLAAREGDLGVNMACYAAHCNIRRWVMGADASERAATEDEVAQMVQMLGEAMEAGAAGLSSTHAPTHNDGDGRPVPSRLAETDELLALATEVGRHQGGSISYLPLSAVGGITQEDMDLLIEIGQASRLPVIIQGLGARSKVDAPTASWEGAVQFLQQAQDEGAAIYSLLLARPFDRPFTLLRGTNLYEGVPAWNDLLQLPVEERIAALSDPATRDELREAVENPNRDPDKGSTLPPPHWKVLFVGQVARDENKDLEGASIFDLAEARGVTPADAMLDLALSEDLETEFRWITETRGWMKAVKTAQHNPHMLVGTSDGGAHLSRDDGSDYSTYFLRKWVLEEGEWSLEEGIRQMTLVPASLLGFLDRGMIRPGFWADIMIFDTDEIMRPGTKELVADLPGGAERFQARPNGIHATIVNGEPIVLDGQLTDRRPGRVVAPNRDHLPAGGRRV